MSIRWLAPLLVGCHGPSDGTCGNGQLDAEEVCDSDRAHCGDVGAAWDQGGAECRADCSGWDVSTCERSDPDMAEMVKPAQRDPDRWSTARCNDGTPFGFSVRPRASSQDWVIYLQGGGLCDDNAFPCDTRDPTLVTTPPQGERGLGTLPGIGGVLDPHPETNPTLWQANEVYAWYCSSDFWSGPTTTRRPTAGDPVDGWYFSGQIAVASMLDELAMRYGLDDEDDRTHVLFGGGSAGALGAYTNAGLVTEALPRTASAGRVHLLVDAGWMTAWDDPAHRFGAATTSDRDVRLQQQAFWGATPDPLCAQTDPADCLFAPTWYRTVTQGYGLPVFVQQSSIDSVFLVAHGLDPADPDDFDAITRWHDEVEASLAEVQWLFSGTEPYHTLAANNATYTFGPAHDTLRDALGAFWVGAPPERIVFGDWTAPP
jgi:hypothetical protein